MGLSQSVDGDKPISEGFRHSPNEIKGYKEDLAELRKTYHAGQFDKHHMDHLMKKSAKMEKFFDDCNGVVHHRNTRGDVQKPLNPTAAKLPDEVRQQIEMLTVQCNSLESELQRLRKVEKHLLEENKKLGRANAKLTQDRDELTARLSREMDEKIAKDESNLENISIKNRPMKIAEEYENLCAHSWLAAKELTDKHIAIEEERVKFLRDIMMEEVGIATEKHGEITKKIFNMVYFEAEFGMLSDVTMESKSVTQIVSPPKGKTKPAAGTKVIAEKIPDGLKIAIWDFLRVTADTADVSGICQSISKDLMERMDAGNTLDSLCCTVKDIPKTNMQAQVDFMNDFARLAWKMATQRPQMSFDDKTGLGEPWKGDKYQDVGFTSQNPRDPQNVVKYYELPALLHGDKMMKRGRVFIGKKDSTKQHYQCVFVVC